MAPPVPERIVIADADRSVLFSGDDIRAGQDITYIHNWPPEALVGNGPTGTMLVPPRRSDLSGSPPLPGVLKPGDGDHRFLGINSGAGRNDGVNTVEDIGGQAQR